MNIKEKVVFITGAGSGIGLATVRKLLIKGAKIVNFTKTVTPDLEKEFNSENTLLIEGDVCNRDQVRQAVERTIKKFKSLDILINNAGVAKHERFMETDEKDWNFVIDVNMKGVFICIQEFIKINQRSTTNPASFGASDQQPEKLIVNISSGAGIYGIEEIAVYSATKAAVINLTQSLNEEFKNSGVKFITVAPGSTNTKMFSSLFPEEKPYHTPEQVADVIYKTVTGKIKSDDRLIVDVFHHIK
ncbi:MAG: SDR family oxidoreductase [Patescibacteria group bacterium]|nr:SDR family oxidoreductase [Patescibacteria group bacterium]